MSYFFQAKSSSIRPTAVCLLTVIAVALSSGVGSALAEPPAAQGGSAASPGQPAAQNDRMQAARQLHTEYMELQNRLDQIQEQAMKTHPELQKQRKAFEDLVLAKMSSGDGPNAKNELAAIEKLEQKLNSKDTPEGERKGLMDEYQKKVTEFRTAQSRALADPEVNKAGDAFMGATLEAMKEQDPGTEQLMQKVQQKQKELKQLIEAAGRAQ